MPNMKICDFCGGNADSGCGATDDGKRHYSRIDCANILLKERNLLRDAIDKSNEALRDTVKIVESVERMRLQLEKCGPIIAAATRWAEAYGAVDSDFKGHQVERDLLLALAGLAQKLKCAKCGVEAGNLRASLCPPCYAKLASGQEKTQATGTCFVDHKGGDCPKCF